MKTGGDENEVHSSVTKDTNHTTKPGELMDRHWPANVIMNVADVLGASPEM